MNRKLLALAVGAAFALPMAAQAAPTVYGLLNLSVDKVDIESNGDADPVTPGIQAADYFEVNSNSSRLGVMGEESLGSGLSAVYRAEWAVSGDTASSTDLVGRDRYLGLKGAFDTVKLGAYEAPLNTSQGSVDQFDDMRYTDMGNFISGEVRMDNLIGYESPKLADAVTVKLAVQPGESNANDGIAEAMSASVAYEGGGLYVALAMDNEVSGGAFNPATARDTVRLTGTYTMGSLQLGALVQTAETSDDTLAAKDDEEAVLVSAAYAMGKNVIKGQVIMVNHDYGTADEEETMGVAVGFDHNFTQMTKAFGQFGIAQTDNVGGATGADADDSVFTVGMQTKF